MQAAATAKIATATEFAEAQQAFAAYILLTDEVTPRLLNYKCSGCVENKTIHIRTNVLPTKPWRWRRLIPHGQNNRTPVPAELCRITENFT